MRKLVFHLLALSALAASAESIDSIKGLALIRQAEAPVQLRPHSVFSSNPAAMGFWRNYSYSDISAVGALERADEAVVVEQGRGHTLGNIIARSYMKLSETTSVWGEARFTTGKVLDVVWNNSTDYPLVAPYVFGDSVGGDLSTRQYAFMGGYAGVSGAWSWGAEASYRASVDYRNRDPRDKIIVSDLELRLGATRTFGEYTVGLGADMRVYNQESSVQFYNPNNDIRAYAMIGLGNIYARFSGNSNLDSSYEGLGFGGNVQVFPRSGSGIMANVAFKYLRLTQVLRDYNYLNLTRSDLFSLSAVVAWTRQFGRWSIAPRLNVDAVRRLGYENLFGTAVGSIYLEIGTRRNLLTDRAVAGISLPVSADCGEGWLVSAEPALSYSYMRDDYRRPHRELEAAAWRPSLKLGTEYAFGRNLCRVSVLVAHEAASSLCCDLPGLDPESSIGSALLHNFDMATADVNEVGLTIGYDRQIDNTIVLGIALRGSRAGYCNHGDVDRAEAVVSVRF